jgi:hypothetical protein
MNQAQTIKVGNIGPQPDSILRGDYCMQAGYHTSERIPGQPAEKVCTCREKGEVVLKAPVTDFRPTL